MTVAEGLKFSKEVFANYKLYAYSVVIKALERQVRFTTYRVVGFGQPRCFQKQATSLRFYELNNVSFYGYMTCMRKCIPSLGTVQTIHKCMETCRKPQLLTLSPFFAIRLITNNYSKKNYEERGNSLYEMSQPELCENIQYASNK